MKFFAIIAVALLLICMVQAKKNCRRTCPRIHYPVCASNGNYVKTYPNQCVLDGALCEGDSDFKQVPLENCDTGTKC